MSRLSWTRWSLDPLVALAAPLLLGACTKSEPKANGAPVGGEDPAPAAVGAPAPAPASSSRASPASDERQAERAAMVRNQLASRDITDERVLAAMKSVPRHAFVPESAVGEAYEDRPLPIGHGQTISQPYIVAFMTQAAKVEPGARCLEVGTGSGYQAAVLAEVCTKVYSIEYLPKVAELGAANLRRAGYGEARVALRVGDGYAGWPEAAPFDAILVTASPDHVPQPLLAQLAEDGTLVIPVGLTSQTQVLERYVRIGKGDDPGSFRKDELMGVRFVPFLGDAVERH